MRVVGKLVSVNVALPRVQDFPGGPIPSGIDKRPVTGRRRVARLNIEGDGQGDLRGHGGEHRAVLVYDQSYYAYWGTRYPQLAGAEPGAFGENFTVRGLTDDVVCVGDRYAIGGACFEVTQPRVTCFRLGAHTGVRDLPRAFVAEGRPGFYLRVLVEGEVGAGDEVVCVERGLHELSVRTVDGLLYGSQRPKALLMQALELPALSPGWRSSFEELLAGRAVDAAGRGAAPDLAWDGWRRFVVREKHLESQVDASLSLAPVDGEPLPPYEPGQFVTVRLPVAASGGRRVIRSWSLSDRPRSDAWRITVRRSAAPSREVPAGVASRLVHDVLRVGDELEIAAPRGDFTLRAIPLDAPLVFVTAGVGITPAMAMLESLLVRAPLNRDVWFLHGARDERELTFGQRLDVARTSDPRLHVVVWLSRPELASQRATAFRTGRIAVPALAEFAIAPDAHWFVCGPKAFQDAVLAGLRDAGVEAARWHVESFGAPGSAVAAPPGTALVRFARSGSAVAWDAARFPSLLDLAEEAGAPVRWSCRAGVCHLCQTRLLEGNVAYLATPPDAPPDGQALLCCSVPQTDLILDA